MVFSRAATNNYNSLVYLNINENPPYYLLACRRSQRSLMCLDLICWINQKQSLLSRSFIPKESLVWFSKKNGRRQYLYKFPESAVPHVMQRWLSAVATQELLVIPQDLFWKLAVIHMWRELGLLRPICQASRCMNTKRKTLMSQFLSEAWRMIHSLGRHRQ